MNLMLTVGHMLSVFEPVRSVPTLRGVDGRLEVVMEYTHINKCTTVRCDGHQELGKLSVLGLLQKIFKAKYIYSKPLELTSEHILTQRD